MAGSAQANSQDEASLWQRLTIEHDRTARALLIEHHLETARIIAASLYAKRIDDTVDFGDYLQFARVGLVEAVDRYDPTREASFATFASYRIRGAILNGIEHASEHAAQFTQRKRAKRDRIKSLRQGSTEIDAFSSMVDVAISLALGYMLEESGIWHPGTEDQSSDPYRSLEMKRLSERMNTIVARLPERERMIVRYHYFEHMEFVTISNLLGISKGRVSQLHSRALRAIRDAYRTADQFDIRI